ncbi:MAG: bifunctional phosphopantothenoylcysteine decarboxylase/phosphopantothenate--cysteine ligase CoaBC [Firmicutes bacterium]|nr:bifunctional phosphopantothenoylcysteine decarboxylase/phosphopantothenate--cysteine ligase CoaBC [Bacillota bacterium]
MLKDKNILIGVCGGISAYKVCDLVSRLKKKEANINIIMTRASTNFINPLTFQSLSLNKVVSDMFDKPSYLEIDHISLAKKADIFVIAPATANIMGKIANGIADDMLSTTIMATKAPVVLVPAMNSNMYENPILQDNISLLKNYGYIFIDPVDGRLACGDTGKGKMAEPEFIEKFITSFLTSSSELKGKKIIVTAGPTKEPIDPVRFISNHSTGKMGYAIAEKAANRGADVYLISGPTNLEMPIGVNLINVVSAKEMYNAIMSHYYNADVVIKSAAVSDYKPSEISSQKIKKEDEDLLIKLEKNPDILYELGKIKENKILIGFAMETQNLIENAKEKIKKKNLDFIVANDLNQKGAGFAFDTNIVKIIDKNGHVENISKMAKIDLADIIIDRVIMLLKNRNIDKRL